MTNAQVDLIYQEFLLRYRLGYHPNPEDYIERFPEHAEELRKQFELFRALESNSNWLDASVNGSSHPASSTDGLSVASSVPNLGSAELEAITARMVQQGLPGYTLLHVLGRGSSGMVFEAIQQSTGRHVALKVLSAGFTTSQVRLQRFRLESRIAATLDVQGVVPIYEVGTSGDVHFHSMRLIKGPDLRAVIRILRGENSDEASSPKSFDAKEETHRTIVHRLFGERSSVEHDLAAAKIISGVSRAVDRAHGAGVMHRDIKPANIMIDPDGQPWLTDFGLAHLDGEATMTRTEEMIGTPIYMSPERFVGKTHFFGPASDIYSLGVTLYELLTLSSPYTACPIPELIRQIVDTDPSSCRSVRPGISKDLETIVAKAMAKLPADRYASASELADDLDRYQRGEPIQARRLSRLERTGRRLRRHAVLATSLATTIGLLVALTLITVSVYASYLSRLNRELQSTQRRTNALLYAADMNTAFQAFNDSQPREVERLLTRHIPAPGQDDLRGVEWQILNKQIRSPKSVTLRGHTGPVYELATVPKQWLLVSVGEDRIPRIWDYKQGTLVRTCDPGDGPLWAVAVSPDGKYFVTGNNEIGVWSLATGKRLRTLKKGLPATLESLAIAHKGDMVAYGTRYHHVGVLQFGGGDVYGEIADSAKHLSVSFSRTDEHLRIVCVPNGARRRVRIMDFRLTNTVKDYFHPTGTGISHFVTDDSEKWMYMMDEATGDLSMADLVTGAVVQQASGQEMGASSIGLSFRNTHFCVGRRNGVLEFYQGDRSCSEADPRRTIDLQKPRRVAVHSDKVHSIVGLIDGRFASCSEDGLIQLSVPPDVTPHVYFEPLHGRYASYIKFDQVKKMGCAVDKRRRLWVENASGTWPVTGQFPSEILGSEYVVTPDGFIWAIHKNGRACFKVRLAEPDKELESIPLRREATAISLSRDGRYVALTHHIYGVVYELPSWKVRRVLKTRDAGGDLHFSPAGRKICNGKKPFYVHTIDDVAAPVSIDGPSELRCAYWSGEDELTTGHEAGEICVWDATTGQQKVAMRGHATSVNALCVSQDKKTLFSLGRDLKIRMWHMQTGQPIGELFSFNNLDDAEPAHVLKFSDAVLQLRADGRRLFAHIPSPLVRMHCEIRW